MLIADAGTSKLSNQELCWITAQMTSVIADAYTGVDIDTSSQLQLMQLMVLWLSSSETRRWAEDLTGAHVRCTQLPQPQRRLTQHVCCAKLSCNTVQSQLARICISQPFSGASHVRMHDACVYNLYGHKLAWLLFLFGCPDALKMRCSCTQVAVTLLPRPAY